MSILCARLGNALYLPHSCRAKAWYAGSFVAGRVFFLHARHSNSAGPQGSSQEGGVLIMIIIW